MRVLDAVKAVVVGRRAYQAHVKANKVMDEGKTAEAKAKYAEAMRLYDEAEQLGLIDLSVQLGHVILMQREGQFDRARDLLLELSRRKGLTDDNWFSIRVQYAINQWKRGELDKAIETIGRAAAHNENGLIYATLGMFLVEKARQTGDFEAALAYAQKGLDYDDEDAAVLDNLGQLYEAMAERETDPEIAEADRAKAVDYYKKAHEQRPRQITTIYYLARLYHRAGDDARARKLLSVRDTLYISAICPVSREMIDALAAEVG